MATADPTAPAGAAPLFTILEVHDPADDGDVPVLIDGEISIMDLAAALAQGGFTLRHDALKGRLVIQRADLGVARAAYLRLRLRLRAHTWRFP